MLSLGDRMKRYEETAESVLMTRCPIVIRCDGKGFHNFVKKVGAKRPFDGDFCSAMSHAMMFAASQIEGCLFGYTQSDEITLILRNDQSLESEPWFGNRVQKMCSIVSSMVSVAFNKYYPNESAFFDTRVFAVPNLDEAMNCLIWRQQDAVKNSISSAAYFEIGKEFGQKTAHKQLHGLNQNQRQELLFQKTGINWNDYPIKFKRGMATYKKETETFIVDGNKVVRKEWALDYEIPIFTQDRQFLVNILSVDRERAEKVNV